VFERGISTENSLMRLQQNLPTLSAGLEEHHPPTGPLSADFNEVTKIRMQHGSTKATPLLRF
jgi:hypothetical protein